jgi:antitoxin component YwqK of YwqJK toxin-antitoxin module
LEASFVKGKPVGQHIEWHPNGQKFKEFGHLNGLSEGLYLEWHENGKKANEGKYKDGKEDGKWVRWHPNGDKAMEAEFANGKQVGTQKEWYSSELGGNVKAISVFAEGLKTSEVVYYAATVIGPGPAPLGPDHKMYEKSWIVQGGKALPHGEWVQYEVDGSIKKLEKYKYGVPAD